MDDGVTPTERRSAPRSRPPNGDRPVVERRKTTQKVASERRKAPARRPATPAATVSVADRIDPLMAASTTVEVAEPIPTESKKQRPPQSSPRQRADKTLVAPVDAPDVDKPDAPNTELRVKDDIDFFDLDSLAEEWVDQQVEARQPYVLPKIIPAEPEPEIEESPNAVPTELPTELPAGLVEAEPVAKPKVALGSVLKPKFVKITKQLARSLQPVIVPRPQPRVRRVTRIVRHIDTWSVFKIALLFNIFLYAVCLMAGVMLWRVALNTGTIENIERFFESFGWQTFELKGGEIYHNAWIIGLFAVVGLTGLAVLVATMFNLITDLVGGVRLTVLEEEVVARPSRVASWPRSRRPVAPPRGEPPND